MTSSNGNIFRVTGPLCGEFTGHRWIPLTKASDAEHWCFFDLCWINGWVNNHEAGDLRCHRAYYDVIVMPCLQTTRGWFNIKMLSYQYRNTIAEIRRPLGRLIATMGFPMLVRWYLGFESACRLTYFPRDKLRWSLIQSARKCIYKLCLQSYVILGVRRHQHKQKK